ncbi:MAG: response regulator [Candidatus Eisenbacteria sp.]|nr:response regulator [Candidatus Eisenbacteria bacterium]
MAQDQAVRGYILLAEDEPTNQYVFRAILENGGFEVVIVDNGEVALAEGIRRKPDLILLDMMMPVMDGYETARRMVVDPTFDGVPILALTAKAMKGDAEKTFEAGCDDYMSKPIRRQDLLDTVAEWLTKPADLWMPARLEKREGEGRRAA